VPEKQAKEPLKQMLLLSGGAEIVVKTFDFEGGGKVEDLIVLTGLCPGSRLENLTLHGFNRSAIKIYNCAGSLENPLKLTGLRIFTRHDTDAALLFDLRPNIQDPADNQYTTVDDCLISGPAKVPYQINYPKLNPTVHLPAAARPAAGVKK
jgi:hypothetical protein